MARASRNDVAKLAGVSLSTVSHVMNGRAEELGFSPDTAERVREAARSLGYVPRAAARSLRYRRGSVIGLFISEIPESLHLPVFNELCLAAMDRARMHGYFVLPIPISGDTRTMERSIVSSLREIELAGAICEFSSPLIDAARILHCSDLPVVWFNPRGEASIVERCTSLGIDEGFGISQFADAIDRSPAGHSVVLTGPGRRTRRISTFTEEFANATVVEAPQWLSEAGNTTLDRWLESHPAPEVVFGANDHLAVGALAALRRHGVDVPGHAYVFGYGDYEMAGLPVVQLSSVYWPLRELGVAAVDAVHAGSPQDVVNLRTAAVSRSTTHSAASS